MEAANTFVKELVDKITTFHARTTMSVFRNHGMVSERTETKLRNRYCAAPGEMRIPFSLSAASVKAVRSKKSTKRRKTKRRVVRRKAV